jgi:hypothetical protein
MRRYFTVGETRLISTIQVNEHTLKITKSLRSALFYLRKSDEPRTLWVDAICINQNDLKERGDQVRNMGEIYSRTSRTVVWLGPGDEETDRAFKVRGQLAQEVQIYELLPNSCVDAPIC